MKPRIPLPPELQQQYDEIDSAYDKIADDWKNYSEQIIPEDPVFARKIIGFLIEVAKYIEAHPSKIIVHEWLKFLAEYAHKFYYGPLGDDRNYLDFDEVSLADILLEIDYDNEISTAEIKILKKLLIEARKKFSATPSNEEH